MAEVKAAEAAPVVPAEVKPAPSPDTLTFEDIISNIVKLQKGFVLREERHVFHVLRTIPTIRKKLNARVLSTLLTLAFKGESQYSTYVGTSSMDTSNDSIEVSTTNSKIEIGVEAQNYVILLLLIHLIDTKQTQQSVTAADSLFSRIRDNKVLVSEHLSAKCYFYYSLAHEYNGTANTIRSKLHSALRTCSLRNDEPGQAAIINILLRNYIQNNLIEQADLLISRTTFPESAGSSDWARYLFYLGRVEALQLVYTESFRHLDLASRKAPPTAYGFHQSVQKLKIIVEMLLGEIPSRDIFRVNYLKSALTPYYQLTQAVRVGDSIRFASVVKEFSSVFQKDNTYTLILRLRHNVIKTGIRIICLSYHRISLHDVATKLQLDSYDDAQYIAAKAIHDGVIDAEINFSEGYLESKEVVDVYGTNEPQNAFDQRISFCLKMHNDAIKAMQFPPNAYRKYLETPEQRRERERQEEELAEELGKEDDLDDF